MWFPRIEVAVCLAILPALAFGAAGAGRRLLLLWLLASLPALSFLLASLPALSAAASRLLPACRPMRPPC